MSSKPPGCSWNRTNVNIIIVVIIINRKENLRHTALLDHYPLIRLTWVFQEQNQCEHHHRRRHHQPQGKPMAHSAAGSLSFDLSDLGVPGTEKCEHHRRRRHHHQPQGKSF